MSNCFKASDQVISTRALGFPGHGGKVVVMPPRIAHITGRR
jgi:hypothetical protein